jgi:phenylacetaldehyde dehydrogenase
MMAAWKLAPALAAGCTIVLKPAALTPLSALRFGELVAEAGIPDGVLNIVTGSGKTAGTALVEHPGVEWSHSPAPQKSVSRSSSWRLAV